MSLTGFECLRCATPQDRDFGGYTCPRCDGNLEVTYDYERIRATLDRRHLFRRGRLDLFRYAPLLPLTDLSLAPPLRVGPTPLHKAPRLGAAAGLDRLFVKDDGLLPSGSFKDRASAVALTRAREVGSEVVAAASTGNAGSSLACMAASVGMPCVVFLPRTAPPAKIAQLLVFGARVLAVDGSYDDAFDLCREICRRRGWFNRNTGLNPFTREGKKTFSFELCQRLRWRPPDTIVVPVGDGNILSGVWKGLRELRAVGLVDRLPRLVAAQAEGSAAVSRAVEELRRGAADPTTLDWSRVEIAPVEASTVADSISVDLPRDGLAAVRAVLESGGEAVTAPDDEILAAIPEIARLSGVFVEPSCAAAWAGLKRLADAGKVDPRERIVCLLSGSGLKDIAAAERAAGKPTVIDPTIEAAEAELAANPV